MAWKIEFDEAAERELRKLDLQTAQRILDFLRNHIAQLDDPRSIGEALKGPNLGGLWKYRAEDCRIIASIEDRALYILIVRVGNHREVYR
jgi:mRNA interferase RelE/StbE